MRWPLNYGIYPEIILINFPMFLGQLNDRREHKTSIDTLLDLHPIVVPPKAIHWDGVPRKPCSGTYQDSEWAPIRVSGPFLGTKRGPGGQRKETDTRQASILSKAKRL